MAEDTRIRVLFVDDDPSVLGLLTATIGALRKEWDGAVAGSGEEALRLLEERSFDVVVSDMRMPGMGGGELLNRVMRQYPGTARLIMSGFADEETVIASVGAAHQYLPKPFELRTLRGILGRIRKLNQRLQASAVRGLAAQLPAVPSVPEVYFEMLEAMQSADSPLEAIAEIMSRDPGMTAKLLQLVNSAFFGFSRECGRVVEAVQMLGVTRVRALALGMQVFSAFDAGKAGDFPLEQLWQHSLQTGLWARRIAEEEGCPAEMREQAFTAGVMHDLGQLALATGLPEVCREIRRRAATERRPLFEVEREVWGADHGGLGGHLLGLWGLPAPLVEAVALHHEPSASEDTTFSVTTAVHVANALAHARGEAEAAGAGAAVDRGYLERLGLGGRWEGWRALLGGFMSSDL